MIAWLKRVVKRYDNWCESMGLTQGEQRCCVPVSKDDIFDNNENTKKQDDINKAREHK